MSGDATQPAPGPVADTDVPAFWRSLELPGLIDAHVHFLPPRMLRRVWEHFDTESPMIGRAWPIRYKWPDEQRVAHLAALGVRIFPALAYAHRAEMAADLNDWTLAFAAATPGCLPSATFYPEPGVAGYLGRALAAGTAIVKVHLQVGNFDPREPILDEVWGMLADAGTPVVVHAGSGPVPGRYTGAGPIGDVLARHPRLTVVIAHMGAPEYLDFLALADRYPRVLLDTTMAFTPFFESAAPFPRPLRPRVRDLGLSGRILLGSDFPNIPYPYAQQLASLVGLDLGVDWLRRVCWYNAAELFRTPGPTL